MKKKQIDEIGSNLINFNHEAHDNQIRILQRLDAIKKNSDELVFANIFHDTIKDSEWFNIPLSLSSGAIGYNMAYIIYRTLNDIKPKNILELGLGQSTKIINEYAKHFKGIKHDIVEHDKNWIEFFEKSVDMSEMHNIHLLESYKKEYNNSILNAYKDFAKEFKGRKFDFIVIDGPVGVDQEYSRMDILDIIPECLNETFVLLLDDCERVGEQETIKLIENKLKDNNIKFNSGYQYMGRTNVYTLVSPDLEFLCHI